MISVISIEKVKLVHYIVIICLGLIRTFMSLSLSHQPPPPPHLKFLYLVK